MRAVLLSKSMDELQKEFGEGLTDINGNPVEYDLSKKDDHVPPFLSTSEWKRS